MKQLHINKQMGVLLKKKSESFNNIGKILMLSTKNTYILKSTYFAFLLIPDINLWHM